MSNSSKYELLAQQLQALIEGEPDLIANLSNASAAINEALGNINWAGFYLVKDHFRESLPASASRLEKGYAEPQHRRTRRSLSKMCMNFQGILRVTVHRAQRLSFRFMTKMVQ